MFVDKDGSRCALSVVVAWCSGGDVIEVGVGEKVMMLVVFVQYQ